jgi:RING finger protein 26
MIRNQIESSKEQRLCVICQEKEKGVVLLPCRHMCLCDACAKHDELKQCPLCREKILHKISVFS